MGFRETFAGLESLRAKVEGFKNDHKAASAAIRGFISILPTPFDKFCSVIWEGVEREDDSADKMLAILERMSKSTEASFAMVREDISMLLAQNATKEDIKQIGEQIRTSTTPFHQVLGHKLDEINDRLIRIELRLDALAGVQRPEEVSDEVLFRRLRVAFDRGAFKSRWDYLSDVEDFKRVISDTIKIVNSGLLEKNGVVKYSAKGKGDIKNEEWYEKMEHVEAGLRRIKDLIEYKDREGLSPAEVNKIDEERYGVILMLNGIFSDIGIRPIQTSFGISDPYALQRIFASSQWDPEMY